MGREPKILAYQKGICPFDTQYKVKVIDGNKLG